MNKFKIEIWFDSLPNKIKLGQVFIYAETEEAAMEMAKAHTSYQVSGVDQAVWKVREPAAAYV